MIITKPYGLDYYWKKKVGWGEFRDVKQEKKGCRHLTVPWYAPKWKNWCSSCLKNHNRKHGLTENVEIQCSNNEVTFWTNMMLTPFVK